MCSLLPKKNLYTKFSGVVICSDYLIFFELNYSTHCKCCIIRFSAGTCCKLFVKKICILMKDLNNNYFLSSYAILGYYLSILCYIVSIIKCYRHIPKYLQTITELDFSLTDNWFQVYVFSL